MDCNTKLRLELLEACLESCIRDQYKTRKKTHDKELYTYCDGMIQAFEVAQKLLQRAMYIDTMDEVMFARACHKL